MFKREEEGFLLNVGLLPAGMSCHRVLTSEEEKVSPFPEGKLREKPEAGLGKLKFLLAPRTWSLDFTVKDTRMCARE